MGVQSAAIQVLKEAGKPLHANEIAKRLNTHSQQNLQWNFRSQTIF